jgi:hypothetical protein
VGDDTLNGGAGDDVLIGGAGHNTMDGGPGDNIVIDRSSASTRPCCFSGVLAGAPRAAWFLPAHQPFGRPECTHSFWQSGF